MVDIELNEERYVALLERLIGETRHLQNNPPEFVPEEDRAVQHVLAHLAPLADDAGGPLRIKRVAYQPGRSNLLVTYPAAAADGSASAPKCVSFVGAHLDVVPADPATWKHDPFTLRREGDMLYGRGTTDCLGHVALLAEMLRVLGEQRPALALDVVVVFIASEESSAIPHVGVDELLARGELDALKGGPAYWVDSADSQPCIGTATALQWKLTATGKLFHSGLPHKAINAIELAMDAVSHVQKRFYTDFPPHASEQKYNFATPSTLKPTQIRCAAGSLNQIPPHCTVEGDARVTPFYEASAVVAAVRSYVAEFNEKLHELEGHGPAARYVIAVPSESGDGTEELRGRVELEFDGDTDGFRGIACNIDSAGFKALCDATEAVLGSAKPYSITGSLPLVKQLQEGGLDVQICGYGKSHVYHGDNEYCCLSDMADAMRIFSRVITSLHNVAAQQ